MFVRRTALVRHNEAQFDTFQKIFDRRIMTFNIITKARFTLRTVVILNIYHMCFQIGLPHLATMISYRKSVEVMPFMRPH